MIPGIAASAVVPKANLQYVTNVVQDTAATTYTFSAISTAGDGVLLIGLHNENADTTVPTVTVDGNAASLVVGSRTTTPGYGASIFKYEDTVGSTATIVVTFSGGKSRCAISTWRLSGAASTTPVHTSAPYAAAGATGLSTSATVGLGMGLAIQTNHGGEVVTISNSAANWLSSKYNVATTGNTSRFLGIAAGPTPTNSNLITVADTFPTSTDDAFMVFAFWV